MKHPGTVPLETGRLLLRQLLPDDAEGMFRNWAGDAEVARYLSWPAHRSSADTRAYLESRQEKYASRELCDWGIVLRQTGGLVGSIGVVRFDDKINSAHVGYCVGRPWWHWGIASEAFAAVIRFLMEQAGVNRVDARHDPRNAHSGGVMRKCGLHYEGTLRQADWNNQGLCDAAWYSILRGEYFQGKPPGSR